MRIVIRIIQLLVGLLFIVSGLVKANDPLGLAYKMQEFFELWNSSLKAGHFFLRTPLISIFDFLHDEALVLSITMITLEIVAGVALIIGWSRRFIVSLLLILILFFTFLTGYAFLSGKFTNCGCFGDCIPITPFASFVKDVVLLVMILILVFGQRYLAQWRYQRAGQKDFLPLLPLLVSLVVTLGIQWYALTYLPPVDCLPFKKGNNIAEQSRPPKGSVPDSIAIRFIYEKGGKRFEFAPEQLPADFDTYKYIDRVDKVVRKGNAEPKIKGFSLLAASGEDSSNIVLNQPKAIIAFGLEAEKGKWVGDFKKISQIAKSRNIPLYFASPIAKNWMPLLHEKGISDVQLFNTDFTVARTVARTNPTLLFLETGTVKYKYSNHNFDDAVADLNERRY